MRRTDKEISNQQEMVSIIHQATVCRVAFSDNNLPYIATLCFGYEDHSVFVHGALKGRKIDMLRKNPAVCVQFDTDIQVLPARDACKWGVKYRSVIASGSAALIEDPKEKRNALNVIMQHYAGADGTFLFPDSALTGTAVIKIAIEEMTGKHSGF